MADEGEFWGSLVDVVPGEPEADTGGADADFVAVLEGHGVVNEVLVEEGAVSALEVAEDIAGVAVTDFAVLAGGEAVVHEDGVIIGAAEGDAWLVGDDASWGFGVVHIEDRHRTTSVRGFWVLKSPSEPEGITTDLRVMMPQVGGVCQWWGARQGEAPG